MTGAKSTTPALRFKGFDVEWEEQKASKIFLTVADKGHPDLPVLSATQDRGMIKREHTGINISHDERNEITYKRVMPGQFVIHLRSFQGGLAHSTTEGITSPAYTVMDFIHKEHQYDQYWKHIFNSEKFIKSLEAVTYGIRDGRSISFDDLSTLSFTYPDAIEQKKIGKYFQNLDSLIALQRRKLVKLQNIKKAMLQKMFPTPGSTTPQIRFAGFTVPWERQKLLDTVDKLIDFRGRTPKKLGMDWSESGYLALSALNVKNGYIDLSIDAHYGDDALYDAWMAGNELRKGQVLFTTEAPMGNVAQVPDDKRYILSQRTIAFVVSKAVITDNFLATVLRTPTSVSELTTLSSGGTAKGVSQKSLSSFHIPVPTDMKEQEKIAMLFQDFDNRIVLQQHKVENLQNVKKACLQRMFA